MIFFSASSGTSMSSTEAKKFQENRKDFFVKQIVEFYLFLSLLIVKKYFEELKHLYLYSLFK
jgi:hypothetical protein